jgi:hypothetical protein
MPDLHELLNDAVDAPAPLDLDGLGRRVARRRQRRRALVAGAAVIAMALVGAGAVALASRAGNGDETGNDIEMVPPAGDEDGPGTGTTDPTDTTDRTGTTESAAGSESPTGTDNPANPFDSVTSSTVESEGAPGTGGTGGTGGSPTETTVASQGLPACRPQDISIEPDSEGATAQQVIHPGVQAAAGGRPCSIDATATVTLRSPTTDEVLAIDTNPVTVALSGTVGDGQGQGGVDNDTLLLSGCLPGDGFDDRGDVVVDVTVAGLGTGRATVMGSRCVNEGDVASFGTLG